MLNRIAVYSVDDVRDAVNARTKSRVTMPDGRKFRYSIRLRLFLTTTVSCMEEGCTREGVVFALETNSNASSPHLNLYAVDNNGKWALMTKDHIHPKSKGGPDTLENLQTMCARCNEKKADKVAA